ncbi:hypothetical protein HDU96_006914 [Phlyctochytrium bullatum]|nr:hypothetical protein HDU96_006914 [Phlyctochytrium bullatum]
MICGSVRYAKTMIDLKAFGVRDLNDEVQYMGTIQGANSLSRRQLEAIPKFTVTIPVSTSFKARLADMGDDERVSQVACLVPGKRHLPLTVGSSTSTTDIVEETPSVNFVESTTYDLIGSAYFFQASTTEASTAGSSTPNIAIIIPLSIVAFFLLIAVVLLVLKFKLDEKAAREKKEKKAAEKADSGDDDSVSELEVLVLPNDPPPPKERSTAQPAFVSPRRGSLFRSTSAVGIHRRIYPEETLRTAPLDLPKKPRPAEPEFFFVDINASIDKEESNKPFVVEFNPDDALNPSYNDEPEGNPYVPEVPEFAYPVDIYIQEVEKRIMSKEAEGVISGELTGDRGGSLKMLVIEEEPSPQPEIN